MSLVGSAVYMAPVVFLQLLRFYSRCYVCAVGRQSTSLSRVVSLFPGCEVLWSLN